MAEQDLTLKFIIIGDPSTGKTCLMHQWVDGTCPTETSHTVGVEFGSRIIQLGETSVKLQCWDTAGQERFRSVSHAYFREAIGCLLVYDITSRLTFNHVVSWLRDCRLLASPHVQIVLVGNKMDAGDRREVPFTEAARFAQENEMMFLETSAVTGEGVEEAFLTCCRAIVAKLKDESIPADSFGVGVQWSEKASPLRQARKSGTKKSGMGGTSQEMAELEGDEGEGMAELAAGTVHADSRKHKGCAC